MLKILNTEYNYNKLIEYQESGVFHPLICPHDFCKTHGQSEGALFVKLGGKFVYLKCCSCDYIQYGVPESIVELLQLEV